MYSNSRHGLHFIDSEAFDIILAAHVADPYRFLVSRRFHVLRKSRMCSRLHENTFVRSIESQHLKKNVASLAWLNHSGEPLRACFSELHVRRRQFVTQV